MDSNKEHYIEVFKGIYENYGFGSTESHSGPGSTLEETELLRKEIVRISEEKGIKTIVDIPCGDFHWMKEIVFRFEFYLGGDIVPQCVRTNTERYGNSRIHFFDFDIITDPIPEGDLLIVRDILGHIKVDDGKEVVKRILEGYNKYLFSTTWYNINDDEYYKGHDNRGPDSYGRFYPVNLMAEPFNWPKPDTFIEEIIKVDGYDEGVRKVLGFWDLDKVREHFKEKEKQERIETHLYPSLDAGDTFKDEEDTAWYYFQKYGTDKAESGYDQHYHKNFKNIRPSIKKVLEIGIGTLQPEIKSTFYGNLQYFPDYKPGGSLRAWRDYFPNAEIYGVDIAEDCLFEEERIKTFLFDSADKVQVNYQLKGEMFDIIIDDGDHWWEKQIKTLELLWPKLENGGIYVIEDVSADGSFNIAQNEVDFNLRIKEIVGDI